MSQTIVSSTRTASAPSLAAHRLFFPAAAAYAAVIPALSLAAMRGALPGPPGLATPLGHAHELLFGFGLAVAAGFLLNRIDRLRLGTLFALWLAGRGTALADPESAASLLTNSWFSLCLAAQVAPPLLTAAKRWRNRALGPILILLASAVPVFYLVKGFGLPELRYPLLHAVVMLFATLMLFMGGRILGPAVAGYAGHRGIESAVRVQPRLEAILLILMGAALAVSTVPAWRTFAGGLLMAAGAVAAVRLLRWRLWRCRERYDLLCLGAGYAWLAVGLALWGWSIVTGLPRPGVALHAITIGAMGTLSISVMARTRLVKVRASPADAAPIASVLAISAAAGLRLALPEQDMALAAAAGLWGLAYASSALHQAVRP